jgi:two-component system response regulator FlrC
VKNLKAGTYQHAGIVAYGINVDSKVAAANAIKALALKSSSPLPPEEELIAAVLESIADEKEQIISVVSDRCTQLISLAERIAPSDANVLVTGESGTGKEVMASFLHNKSLQQERKICIGQLRCYP